MVSGKYSMKCEQGATLFLDFQWTEDDGTTPIDLTGYSVRMMVREEFSDTTPTLDVGGGGWITINDAANGRIRLSVPATETDDLTPGNFKYDIEVEDTGGFVTRLLEGPFIVYAEVTK